jgi:CBS domain containing-hemolysin-like protein
MRAGNRSARALLGFLENPEDFLWAILIGSTLVNFFTVALVTAGLHDWLGDQPVRLWAAFIGLVFLLYTLADLLPKMLFQTYPNRLCTALVKPFRYVFLGLHPLVSLITAVSRLCLQWTGGRAFTGRLFRNREELRQVMQDSAQSFTTEERSMINRVLDFQNLTVRQVLVPLDQVVTVTTQTPIPEVLRLCRERGLSRLLVEDQKGGRRRITGLINLKTLLYRPDIEVHGTAGDFLKPALFLTENLRLEDALRQMQRSGQRLAIVLGSERQELGILSLQDVLRAIFGKLDL